MNRKAIFFIWVILIAVSCRNKDTKFSDNIPIILLQPEQADTLKVSDYFDHVSAVWLKDCLYSDIDDFIEIGNGYLTKLTSPHYLFLLFNKEGVYSGPLGGKGAWRRRISLI